MKKQEAMEVKELNKLKRILFPEEKLGTKVVIDKDAQFKKVRSGENAIIGAKFLPKEEGATNLEKTLPKLVPVFYPSNEKTVEMVKEFAM